MAFSMRRLTGISNNIIRDLSRKEKARESGIAAARKITREAGSMIHDIHKGKDVGARLKKQTGEVKKLHRVLKGHPDLLHGGFVNNAVQEYAEASIFNAVINGLEVASPKDLGINDIPYSLGLADVVGELRRYILNLIIDRDLVGAKKYFKHMERLTEIISKFNFPDGMIPIRRKQDVARSLLEKTQGELAVALSNQSLEKKLDRQ
jgi:translin